MELLDLFEANDIDVIVDGGWSIDALLGKQTREHNDLDLAVNRKQAKNLREILGTHGYQEIRRDGEANLVLADSNGNEIDVHIFEFDKENNNIYGIEYPCESLKGTGTIGDRTVKCISPKYMVEFIAEWVHKWPQKYAEAIPALCKKYSIPLPEQYKKFVK